MNPKKTVNLKKIAEHLGLGITTVSDILLRGKTNYRATTIEKVRQAALDLKFQPNALAQSMRSGNTKTIGLLITFNIVDPFFAEVVNHLEDLFEKAGYMVLLSISDKNVERDRQVLRFFESRRVDGVVMGPVYDLQGVASIQDYYKTSLPCVSVLADPRITGDQVNLKEGHYTIGQMAAEYFLEAGHTRMGYIMASQPLHREGDKTPFRGFYETLKAAGCYEEKWIWPAEQALPDLAFNMMKSILAENRLEDLPTAIYCHNDHCALGAISAAKSAGYRVPEQLSFMGTDNILTSAFMTPPLTTIDLCAREMAEEVASLLLDRMNHPNRPKRERLVKPRLVQRDSVRRFHRHRGPV
jgi:DNA-binding LacI/PurR family transcriptional regulator